jgi:hypothetical protein
MPSLFQGEDIMKHFPSITSICLAGACLALSLPIPAVAESQCRGMAQTDCAATQHCRWVDSYVRKDGREVNGYCRASSSGSPPQGQALKTGAAD